MFNRLIITMIMILPSLTLAQPTVTSSGRPYCSSAAKDPDNDGFGWENANTCIVMCSSVDSDLKNTVWCSAGSVAIEAGTLGAELYRFCDGDAGSWGDKKDHYCI